MGAHIEWFFDCIVKSISKRLAYYSLGYITLLNLYSVDIPYRGIMTFVVVAAMVALDNKPKPVTAFICWALAIFQAPLNIALSDYQWTGLFLSFLFMAFSFYNLRCEVKLLSVIGRAQLGEVLYALTFLRDKVKEGVVSISQNGFKVVGDHEVSGIDLTIGARNTQTSYLVTRDAMFDGYYRLSINDYPLWIKAKDDQGEKLELNAENIEQAMKEGVVRAKLDKNFDRILKDVVG